MDQAEKKNEKKHYMTYHKLFIVEITLYMKHHCLKKKVCCPYWSTSDPELHFFISLFVNEIPTITWSYMLPGKRLQRYHIHIKVPFAASSNVVPLYTLYQHNCAMHCAAF